MRCETYEDALEFYRRNRVMIEGCAERGCDQCNRVLDIHYGSSFDPDSRRYLVSACQVLQKTHKWF